MRRIVPKSMYCITGTIFIYRYFEITTLRYLADIVNKWCQIIKEINLYHAYAYEISLHYHSAHESIINTRYYCRQYQHADLFNRHHKPSSIDATDVCTAITPLFADGRPWFEMITIISLSHYFRSKTSSCVYHASKYVGGRFPAYWHYYEIACMLYFRQINVKNSQLAYKAAIAIDNVAAIIITH